MKRIWKYGLMLSITTATVLGWHYATTRASISRPAYATAEVLVDTVETTVSGTGSLSALGTVEVGSQVSGILQNIYVDFNDYVEEGQLLAELDRELFETSLSEARADRDQALARMDQAQDEHNRASAMHTRGLLADSDLLSAKTTLATANASVETQRARVQRAEKNLRNTSFYSPITGTVIERNVEEGQTVAASLQAPVLFVIAEDLRNMEIHGLVDESDIGVIRTGQNVKFSVQAYPDDTFTGAVRQIRLNPTAIQNVVHYTVVIDAPNERGLLLPGMTATVDYIVNRADDVTVVPNAALRFGPDAATSSIEEGDHVWVLAERGSLSSIRVQTGVTDGIVTEIHSAELPAGSIVVTGTSTGSATNSETRKRGVSGLLGGTGPGGPPPF